MKGQNMKTMNGWVWEVVLVVGLLAVSVGGAWAQSGPGDLHVVGTVTNASPTITAQNVADFDNGINSLIPLLPPAWKGYFVAAIVLLSLLGHVGRVIQGYRTSGILGAISGLFAGTNSPSQTGSYPPPPANPRGNSGAVGLMLCGILAFGLTARAQTNQPAITATNILGNNPVAVAVQDVVNIATPLAPYLVNSNITLSVGGGENTSSHSPVALAILTVPVGPQTSLGIIGGYANGGWYEGGAAVEWGVTNTWPVLGTVRSIAGDGIVYNIANREPANYSYGGFEKRWSVNDQWTLGASIVTANTSDAAGVDIIGFISATYHW